MTDEELGKKLRWNWENMPAATDSNAAWGAIARCTRALLAPDPHSPIPMSPDSLREFYARAPALVLPRSEPRRWHCVAGLFLLAGALVGVIVLPAIWRG